MKRNREEAAVLAATRYINDTGRALDLWLAWVWTRAVDRAIESGKLTPAAKRAALLEMAGKLGWVA